MTFEAYQIVNRILTKAQLDSLKIGDEVIITGGHQGYSRFFTAHGKVQTPLKPDWLLTLEECIELPIRVSVDPNKPDSLVDFLRGLDDPRYARQGPRKYTVDPVYGWEIYSVRPRFS